MTTGENVKRRAARWGIKLNDHYKTNDTQRLARMNRHDRSVPG